MAKFLITYKIAKIEYQTVEVEETDIMDALNNSRARAKALTTSQPDSDVAETTWNVIAIKSMDGE